MKRFGKAVPLGWGFTRCLSRLCSLLLVRRKNPPGTCFLLLSLCLVLPPFPAGSAHSTGRKWAQQKCEQLYVSWVSWIGRYQTIARASMAVHWHWVYSAGKRRGGKPLSAAEGCEVGSAGLWNHVTSHSNTTIFSLWRCTLVWNSFWRLKKNPLSFNGTKKRCALFPPQLDGRKSKVKENK